MARQKTVKDGGKMGYNGETAKPSSAISAAANDTGSPKLS
jgi:hypothetical protein